MAKRNYQDRYLNELRSDGVRVKVRFLDGTEMFGQISAFDSFSIMVIEEDGDDWLLYKHGIQGIAPAEE